MCRTSSCTPVGRQRPMPDTNRCSGRWSSPAASSAAGRRGGAQGAGRDWVGGWACLAYMNATTRLPQPPSAAPATLRRRVVKATEQPAPHRRALGAAGGRSCTHLGSRTRSLCCPAAHPTAGRQSWWGLRGRSRGDGSQSNSVAEGRKAGAVRTAAARRGSATAHGNPSVTPASTGPPSLQCALKPGSSCKQAGRR